MKRNHDILVDALRPFLALCVGEGREKESIARSGGGVHFCMPEVAGDWANAGVYRVHCAGCNCHWLLAYPVPRPGP